MKIGLAIERVQKMATTARTNEAQRRHAANAPGIEGYMRRHEEAMARLYAEEAGALEAVLEAATAHLKAAV